MAARFVSAVKHKFSAIGLKDTMETDIAFHIPNRIVLSDMECQVWYTLGEPDDKFLRFFRWGRRYGRSYLPLFTFGLLAEHVSGKTTIAVAAVVVVSE